MFERVLDCSSLGLKGTLPCCLFQKLDCFPLSDRTEPFNLLPSDSIVSGLRELDKDTLSRKLRVGLSFGLVSCSDRGEVKELRVFSESFNTAFFARESEPERGDPQVRSRGLAVRLPGWEVRTEVLFLIDAARTDEFLSS